MNSLRKVLLTGSGGGVNLSALLMSAFMAYAFWSQSVNPNAGAIGGVVFVPLTGIILVVAGVFDAVAMMRFIRNGKSKSSRQKAVAGLVLGGSIVVVTLVLGFFGWLGWEALSQQASANRVIGRTEFIKLINACGVTFFSPDNGGKVQISYNYQRGASVETGDPANWPNSADGAYFTDYQRAADAASSRCGGIQYSKD